MVETVENTELLDLINEFIEINEGEEEKPEKLAELSHIIDHGTLDSTFVVITNPVEDDYNEILRLTIEDENHSNSYFIPAYTSLDEAKKGVKPLELEEDNWKFEYDTLLGLEILEIGEDEEEFLGIVINPYETDFIVPKEDLIATRAHNH